MVCRLFGGKPVITWPNADTVYKIYRNCDEDCKFRLQHTGLFFRPQCVKCEFRCLPQRDILNHFQRDFNTLSSRQNDCWWFCKYVLFDVKQNCILTQVPLKFVSSDPTNDKSSLAPWGRHTIIRNTYGLSLLTHMVDIRPRRVKPFCGARHIASNSIRLN